MEGDLLNIREEWDEMEYFCCWRKVTTVGIMSPCYLEVPYKWKGVMVLGERFNHMVGEAVKSQIID